MPANNLKRVLKSIIVKKDQIFFFGGLVFYHERKIKLRNFIIKQSENWHFFLKYFVKDKFLTKKNKIFEILIENLLEILVTLLHKNLNYYT